MKAQDFHISMPVQATPHEVFANINNVTQWWTENLEGSSQKLHDQFLVRFGDIHYSKQKVMEFIPDKKVVWLVTDDSQLNFIQNKQEWTNTRIVFEILNQNNQTHLQFTRIGLASETECFRACSNAWSGYIRGSLFHLISTGKGQPDRKVSELHVKS